MYTAWLSPVWPLVLLPSTRTESIRSYISSSSPPPSCSGCSGESRMLMVPGLISRTLGECSLNVTDETDLAADDGRESPPLLQPPDEPGCPALNAAEEPAKLSARLRSCCGVDAASTRSSSRARAASLLMSGLDLRTAQDCARLRSPPSAASLWRPAQMPMAARAC